MKECMKTNNPTDFFVSGTIEQYIRATAGDVGEKKTVIGVDESNPPDKTTKIDVAFPWYGGKVVNTAYSVNLRAEPNLDSAVMAHIHPNSEFMISAIRNPAWYKVRLKDGTEGYASSKFVAKVMPDEHT